MDLDQVPTGFETASGTAYLNTAAMALGFGPSVQALHDAADAWAAGRLDFVAAERAGEQCRAYVGVLIGAPAEDVALIPSASAAAGQLASHLARDVERGSIVVGAEEYTSALFPWYLLEQAGFEVRLVPHRDGRLLAEDVDALCDGSTRLIAFSVVQSASGWRCDVDALRAIADRCGALLYADASQAAGSLVLDAVDRRVDMLSTVSQKFLLGSRGIGYAYIAPTLQEAMAPVGPGWKAAAEPLASFYGPAMVLSPTASRFDHSLAWLPALTDVHSLGLLAGLGIAQVDARRAALVEHLGGALHEAGVPFWDHPAEHRSAIVSVAPSSPDAGARLAEAGVVVSSRAGRIRLSVHVTTTRADLDRAVEVLRRP